MSELQPSLRSHEPQEITRLLGESASGSSAARDELLALVYEELRVMALSRMRQERRDHTLSATALVNEAYLRLFRSAGAEAGSGVWSDRKSFFTASATAMRRILVDHARARASQKRGGDRRAILDSVALDVLQAAQSLEPEDMLALDDAISRLEELDERAAQVVRLRFYAGLEIAEVAPLLDVSERTVKRDWEFARAWLREALGERTEPDAPVDE